jgi:hypothetical protein
VPAPAAVERYLVLNRDRPAAKFSAVMFNACLYIAPWSYYLAIIWASHSKDRA